jgi:tol-pal system protein YbgF
MAGCASAPSPDQLNLPAPSPEFPPPQQTPVSDARISELQTSMTELLERLDVMNDRMAKMEAAQADMTSSTERRQTERSVEPAVVAPPPTPPTRPAPVVVPAVSAPMPAVAAATSAPPRAVPPPARADIYATYRNGLVLYGKNRWADARAAFQQVFDAEPSGELADNALYWIGETYYAAADYPDALRYYMRVTKDFPNENKAPDAMFKMGLVHERTGDLSMAKKTFEETIRRYPYATPAASAKAALSRIKY